MKNFLTKRPVRKIRVSLQDKVAQLLKNKAKSQQVKFIFNDGTSIVQELKEEFINRKRVSVIVDDLKAIQHDLGAKYFVL